MDKKLGLGKGLSMLMGEEENSFSETEISSNKGQDIIYINLNILEPSPYQPRRVFDENALMDLVESIRSKGVLQPLLVRKNPKNTALYEIIAGERRYRASKLAGLTEVPVIVKDFDNKATLEVALIENLQREDLSPLEEADAYKRLLREFNYTQEELSQVVGKSRSYVANMMRLLELPDIVRQNLEQKQISVGHARALLNVSNPEQLLKQILEKGLNVRQTEKLTVSEGGKTERNKGFKKIKETIEPQKKDSDIMALENELTQMLKTPVSIKWSGKGGEIVIVYDGLDRLDIILQRLTNGGPLPK